MNSSNSEVFEIYDQFVGRFEFDSEKGTGREWTPYRFCSEDWLLAVAVARASRQRYEIAYFECEDHRDFEPDSGLKAALSFLLADSFHRTGKMELRFCGPRNGEAANTEIGYCYGIPQQIRQLCESLGIRLNSGATLSDEHGQRLYQQMVGLDKMLARKLQESGADPTRSAFLMHRGVLGMESLELFANYSLNPQAILEGRLVPDRWLAFKRELVLMRRGLLAERVHVLFERSAKNERERIDITWSNASSLEIRSQSSLRVTLGVSGQVEIPQSQRVEVLLCPLDQFELRKVRLQQRSLGSAVGFVVFTRDYTWMNAEDQRSLADQAKECGLNVVTIHESLDELDSEAMLRLERFATTRMAIQEQKE